MASPLGPIGSNWFLRGARVALSPQRAERLDVRIGGGKILELLRPGAQPGDRPAEDARWSNPAATAVDVSGCLLLPGLINAHDHLEFSLFPRLGRGPFPNAREWARAVYQPSESPVREQLQIPKPERLIWGGLKNLLSGVTTVCHHNPYQPEVFDNGFPVRVVRRFGWAHSLEFSDDLPARFAATPADEPFIVHLGEATDEAGRRQVFELDALRALDERTVLVHAVALDREGLALVEQRGASLIWCPSSNRFTLGATLDAAVFASNIRVALATDSAMTGEGDLLDELRAARQPGVPAARLYAMVTSESAAVLRLDQGEGKLTAGGLADLIAVDDAGGSPCEAVAGAAAREPLLVMVGGELKLVDEEFAGRLNAPLPAGLRRIHTAGRRPCLVDADVPALLASARRALGAQEVRLAGKVVDAGSR
jgi:cytosine/adenosine deaminase-related metal-dependent hydrolase